MHNIEFRINTAGPMLVVYGRGQNAVDGERYCILANDMIPFRTKAMFMCAKFIVLFTHTIHTLADNSLVSSTAHRVNVYGCCCCFCC